MQPKSQKLSPGFFEFPDMAMEMAMIETKWRLPKICCINAPQPGPEG